MTITVDNDFDLIRSASMQEVVRTIELIAASDLNVLIIGEQGTGKEWAARAIHRISTRTRGPFCPFDCAALSSDLMEEELFGFEAVTREGVTLRRGLLEDAEGGTILINELSSLPPTAQMRVARALEYQTINRVGGDTTIHIDVRMIATLGRPADALIAEGTLLSDTFYRISPIIIELPPLRERTEDIPALINKFIGELRTRYHSKVTGISQEALDLCTAYPWPGNIRHLKNAIEYAAVMCTEDSITPKHLPPYMKQSAQHPPPQPSVQ
jgi:DNA-binding NtrC family response regulator